MSNLAAALRARVFLLPRSNKKNAEYIMMFTACPLDQAWTTWAPRKSTSRSPSKPTKLQDEETPHSVQLAQQPEPTTPPTRRPSRFAAAPVAVATSRAKNRSASPPPLSLVEVGTLALLAVLLIFVVYLGIQVHKITRVLYHLQVPQRIQRYSGHF